ncbi:hypothetical protein [Janthinobacterium sp. MDB2-8]|uniref:hypothetical protein n=1 Tax=Janthinobacterium sp. MDB2-8 TaxID=1259338 RepID=UPI003F23B6F7
MSTENASPQFVITISSNVDYSSEWPGAALHRDATALKLLGDWNGAIEKLKLAKVEMLKHGDHSVYSWCRLPFFLQYAGRYAESMQEFDFLIEDVKRQSLECHTFASVKERGMFIRATRHELRVERTRVQAREVRRLKKLAAPPKRERKKAAIKK